MAPRPSSSGISRSIVTTSGSNWWTLRTASNPSRAVATTRNSPSAASPPPRAPSTSVSTRRMSALSSTTRTLGRRSEDDGMGTDGADLHTPIRHREPYGTPRAAAHRLAHDGDARAAQHVAARDEVALTHLHGPRRHELGEHARPARQLGDQAPRLGAERAELLDEERDGRLGKLGRVRGVPREALRRQENVGHRAGARVRVVQHDRYARSEPQRDEDRVAALGGPVRYFHEPLDHALASAR